MIWLTIFFLILASMFGCAAWWSRGKSGAILLFLSFLSLYFGFTELLSRPKPVELEFLQRSVSEPAEIIASQWLEGKAIYLWVRLKEIAEPRYYVLKWNRKVAQALQKAQEEAKGGKVIMRLPFQPSLENRPPMIPHPIPPPKLPDKFGAPEQVQPRKEGA